MNNKEIECRFLEINKDSLIKKLNELGAIDRGEILLEETIIYNKDLTWKNEGRFIRLRKSGDKTKLTYKEHKKHSVDGASEIEFEIDNYKKAEKLFEKIGFMPARHQQKKRHTFVLNNVTIDIDTWPRIPPYIELEGESEEDLRNTASLLGYDWKDVELHNAGWVIENKYNIPVLSMKYFTFDKFE